MTPNVANIPQELKNLPQWVGWKFEQRGERLTKTPKNPRTGGNADTTKPDTWASIQAALISMEKYGFDGIGFVFSESDPFTGIDLDKCLDPETGELELWARRWVDIFQSYTEITPSGTGLHIIVKGRKPEGFEHCKKGRVEVYDRNRFFTMTGQERGFNGSDSVPTG